MVTRGSSIHTGIVACPLRTDSEAILTFLANVLSLTPGTMAVHVQNDPPLIYVHVLHLRSPDDTRRSFYNLEELTVRAFGSPEAILALGGPAADRMGVRQS
ncbi:MAG TPA: Na+/H+ antiporter subunit E [Ilumatobacteraceae bacterium]|nr:Na+/H+ antiporter subunit E [Ilumatobacteraceae bacterium]